MATADDITVSAFRLACAECAEAIAGADWSTAWQKYAQATAIMSGLPVEGEAGNMRTRWRQDLDGLRTAIEEAQTAVGVEESSRFIRTRTRHAV